MKIDYVFVITIAILMLVCGLAVAFLLFDDGGRVELLENDAVRRGYAEWVAPTAARGEPLFQWIEPEKEVNDAKDIL